MATDTELDAGPDGTQPADYLDNLLVLIGHVRAEKPRDPLRRLEDRLLEIRFKVTG